MTMNAKCPTCGALLPADAPPGQCFNCLLKLGLDEDAAVAHQDGFESDAATAGSPKRLGDYELTERIARGGMGVVWKARQVSLNRLVALKMILGGCLASEAEIRRFLTEAEAVARLDHPNIVPIYEIGEEDGQYFFSMKLIEGVSLAEGMKNEECRMQNQPAASKRRPPPFLHSSFSILHFVKVARAVHYAHQRGVLHRDLKPANILIDRQGEPHVTDFGLARLLDAHSALTHSSFAVLGTPPYMAPEQATGRSGAATVATDVYALGAILYELLAGHPPFQGATPLETLRKVATETPMPPLRRRRGKSETRNPKSETNPKAESRSADSIERCLRISDFGLLSAFGVRVSDLEVICLKCLEKDPTHRYASAAELADDLDRWLQGKPIQARPTGPLRRLGKWIKRQPLKAALLAVALCAVLGPIVIGRYYQYFVLPRHARAYPLFTAVQNRYFSLPVESWSAGRASANFSSENFDKPAGGRYAVLEFTNVPPELLPSLPCRVMGDVAGAPDEPLSTIVRHGEAVFVPRPKWRYRAYYIGPVGWTASNLLARAPEAMIKFTLMPPDWKPGAQQTNAPAGTSRLL
jgi:serine/threonine protein kinase